MDEQQNSDLERFFNRIRSGEIDVDDVTTLEKRLLADPEQRRRYRARMRLEANLLASFQIERPEIAPPLMIQAERRVTGRISYLAAAAGIAALMVLAFMLTSGKKDSKSDPVIAHLVSSSEAAWAESSLGTEGAGLGTGRLELKSGLAELRFLSGALVSLEAPATLELINPMRCRLVAGTVLINVPENAKGFIVETAGGYAVDHGTSFAVTVAKPGSSADFEVLSGSISVHHQSSGSIVPLYENAAARLSFEGIESLGSRPSLKMGNTYAPGLVRLRTQGRETSIVYSTEENARELFLNPDLLMVKRDFTAKSGYGRTDSSYDAKHRRSLIGFHLGDVAPRSVLSARLQLNLVPTGLGFASFLPEICTFEIYGICDDAAIESWPATGLRWEDAPGSSNSARIVDSSTVRLLGSVDIPRGKVSGEVYFESPELTGFVREDRTSELGFLIVRSTIPSNDWSLVHAFAASTHPDAAGPTLLLDIEKSP